MKTDNRKQGLSYVNAQGRESKSSADQQENTVWYAGWKACFKK